MMNDISKVMTQLNRHEISRVSGGQECYCWCDNEYMFSVESPKDCKIICSLDTPRVPRCYVWDSDGKEYDLANPSKAKKGSRYPQYSPNTHVSITTAMGSLSLGSPG